MPSIVQLQRQPSKLRRLERFAYVVTAITIIILVVFMSRLFMVSDGNFSEEGHLEREKLSYRQSRMIIIDQPGVAQLCNLRSSFGALPVE